MKSLLATLAISFLFFSCFRPGTGVDSTPLRGYKAVYSTDPEAATIRFTAPKAMEHPGKIYVQGGMILQNDVGAGIHIYNAAEPGNLKPRGFISIPGNLDMSIQGNYLYANSFFDLVVIDIGNWLDLKEVKRLTGAFSLQQGPDFSNESFIVRPERNAYYECNDPGRGVQTGWKKGEIEFCYIYYN